MTEQTANRKLQGTGQFINGLTKSGRVRVVNEGEGIFLFSAPTIEAAYRRAVNRFRADCEGSEVWEKAGRPGNNYTSFTRAAMRKIVAQQRKDSAK